MADEIIHQSMRLKIMSSLNVLGGCRTGSNSPG